MDFFYSFFFIFLRFISILFDLFISFGMERVDFKFVHLKSHARVWSDFGFGLSVVCFYCSGNIRVWSDTEILDFFRTIYLVCFVFGIVLIFKELYLILVRQRNIVLIYKYLIRLF